jgi:uncharacterized protein YbjT (DUF2867 family)
MAACGCSGLIDSSRSYEGDRCVTGASGGIAQALLEQLVDRYHVKTLFRAKTAISSKWEHRGCSVVLGDLSQ